MLHPVPDETREIFQRGGSKRLNAIEQLVVEHFLNLGHARLKDAETDEVLGKMKVSALLEALPKVGKVKAQEIMTELEIAPTRRLRGLGDRQRKALLEKFDFS